MKYWILVGIFLSGCVTTSSQMAEAEWCFLCWRAKLKMESRSEKFTNCDTNLIDCDERLNSELVEPVQRKIRIRP